MELLSAVAYFISGLAVLITYIYIKYLRRDPHVVEHLDKFPGPEISFPLGNAWQMKVENHELLSVTEQWYKESNGTYRLWLGKQGRLMICDAATVEKVLSSSVHIEKSHDYLLLEPWLRTGLLTSKGSKWFSRRKLLTPSFHFKILDDFLEVFNEQSEVLVELLRTECSDGKAFDIFPYLTRCALDIICETAMGKKIEAQKERDSEYVRAIYTMGDLLIKRMLRPWLVPDFLWRLSGNGGEEERLLNILHGFTKKVIHEKKQARQTSNENQKKIDNNDEEFGMTKKKRLAFLDLLLDVSDNGQVLSDDDIREETDTFMFEGHDTTAANLNWTLFCLASNPDCMQKVQEELDGIFDNERSRDITMADIAQMKYLECCVKESLRIFPSVPIFARSIKKDINLENGNVLPAGSHAVIFAYFLHRDPKYFPDPETFNPERFFPENFTGRNPYCYVPFSAGPRNCIGQKFALLEEKVVISKLFLNFSFEACEDVKDMRLVPDLILRPKDGITVKLKERV